MFILCLGMYANARILYLNNTLPTDASIKTFSSVTDMLQFSGSSTEDTVYVAGSSVDYGGITLGKKLVIIGPGYYLTENPETPISKLSARFGYSRVYFTQESEGSVISGMVFDNDSKITIHANNITIKNCNIGDRIEFGIHNSLKIIENTIIEGCYFRNTNRQLTFLSGWNGHSSNFIFKNNIMKGEFFKKPGSDGIISNNLFLNDVFKPSASSTFEIHNNILMSDSEADIDMQSLSESVSHNISAANFFGTEFGNIEFTSASTLLIGAANPTGEYSTDGYYQLNPSANNPAIGNANDDGDIGPFGGVEPYILSGVPEIPIIYEINTGGIVSGDEVPVHIKIRQ